MTDDAQKQIAALEPRDDKSLAEYRRVVGGAVDVLIGRGLPDAAQIEYKQVSETDRGAYLEFAGLLRNRPKGEELPAVFLHPKKWNKQVVVWIDPQGKAGLYGSDGTLETRDRKAALRWDGRGQRRSCSTKANSTPTASRPPRRAA